MQFQVLCKTIFVSSLRRFAQAPDTSSVSRFIYSHRILLLSLCNQYDVSSQVTAASGLCLNPAYFPTYTPTFRPSAKPTIPPTFRPSAVPTTSIPTASPTFNPSATPTTFTPSQKPTFTPIIHALCEANHIQAHLFSYTHALVETNFQALEHSHFPSDRSSYCSSNLHAF